MFLCAYYVAKNDPGEDAIREKLRQSLSHYMIPAFFMRLKNIPLNSSGKVDRFALPRPDANHRPYAAPETPREEAPDAWPGYSEILNRKLCDLHDSYRQKTEKKIMLPLANDFSFTWIRENKEVGVYDAYSFIKLLKDIELSQYNTMVEFTGGLLMTVVHSSAVPVPDGN